MKIYVLILCVAACTAYHYDYSGSSESNVKSEEEDFNDDYELLNVCMLDASGQMYTTRDKNGSCSERVAVGRFKNKITETGWSFLEIETFGGYQPEVQAYAAGVAEGVLTKQLIYYNIQNTVKNVCGHDKDYCARLNNYLRENMQWMRERLLKNGPQDTYWRMVNITMTQLSGMQHAFEGMKLMPSVSFDITDLFMVQLSGELNDLSKVFHKNDSAGTTGGRTSNPSEGKCTGFVKVSPDNMDLFFSHVTMCGLETLTRVMKLYKFAFDKTVFPGHTAAFSGYPGALSSGDDFVLLSSGLGQTETTMNVLNKKLYKPPYVQPQNALHAWLRSIVANTLASSGKHWCDIMERYNSGTYNNQWTIVDFGKFKPGQPLPRKDLVWVQEQMPGMIVSKDLTWRVRKYSYWASYNIPYFEKIANYSGFSAASLKFPAGSMARNWTTYNWAPRARIIKRDHKKVVDMDQLAKLMRYNDYKHEPFSRCNCTPPYTAEAAMSARGDLNDPNGHYETRGMGFANHAGLDMKGTNYAMFQKLAMHAWSEPTYGGPGNLPPFQWSTTKVKTSHAGMPDLWNFGPVNHYWQAEVDVKLDN